MSVYIVTGKLGNGKTLCSVGRIRDKLRAGCVVATNLDLDLVAMLGPGAKGCRVLRIPDKPTRHDLDAIGCGNPEYDESRNGVLVLDECGTWFNARNWQDKTRGDVNGWFLHARKLGWDVLLIVQDIALLDSQARDALAELVVYCRRLDNLRLPIVGGLIKALTGYRPRLPRIHSARVLYGAEQNALLYDRWTYRGTDLFRCYDTRQKFLASYPHGVHSLLTPWHVRGRYMIPRNREFYMRMTKIWWKRFERPVWAAAGVLAGVALVGALAFGLVYRDYVRERSTDFQSVIRSAAVELMVANQRAANVADAVTAEVDSVSQSQPDPLLEGRYIVAWVSNGKQVAYMLGGGSAPAVSTDDLIDAGYQVVPHGRCRVSVKGSGVTHVFTCVVPPAKV